MSPSKEDLRKQLVIELREALELARSIYAMEREGTGNQETSSVIGWFIKEALYLLDDEEYVQYSWFKNFILNHEDLS